MNNFLSKIKGFRLFPKQYGLFPYVFLFYLALPIYHMSNVTGLKQVLGYTLIFLFAVSYRQLFSHGQEKGFPYWLALQLCIVFVLSLFYSPFNLYMGFFPANFIGWFSDKRKYRISHIALSVVLLIPFCIHLFILKTFSSTEILVLIVFMVIMLMAPAAANSMYKRMELEKELDQANEKIKQLVMREERMRIARDLHDTLGHTLSLITLKSQLVEKLVTKNPERARLEAKEIESTSRTALKQVRELVSDMRSITLAEEMVQVEAILDSAGIAFHYEGDIVLKDLPQLTQNIMSMCLREAVTNVVKHSRATSCTVSVHRVEGAVWLKIQDNGIGVGEQHREGNGLQGIRERLSLIEGQLILEDHPDVGTVLLIEAPIIVKQGHAG